MAPALKLENPVVAVDGVYRIEGSRVSLDSIVYRYREGASAEAIADSYPTVPIAKVYGVIAFYLENRSEVDRYLEEGDRTFEQFQRSTAEQNAKLHRKLIEARESGA